MQFGIKGQQPSFHIGDTFDHVTKRVLCQSSKFGSCYGCLKYLHGVRFYKSNKKKGTNLSICPV